MTLADDQLTVSPLPVGARAVVLMLHGGAEQGPEEIDGRSLAFRRTRWMRDAISGRLARAGVGTALLRFSVKGWNATGGTPSPVVDARAALDRLRIEYDGLPVVLLGHSMGARTAAWVADDPVTALAGKRLVAAHGRRDRITSPRATERYVRRAAVVAESARFVDMGGLGHYMLTGVRRWNATAVTETLGLLDRVSGITSPK